MDDWRSADVAVDRAVDHGPRVHGGPGPRGIPRSDQGRPPAIGRLGWPASGQAAALGQCASAVHRNLARSSPATSISIYGARFGTGFEPGERGGRHELTRGSLMAVGRWR
jgi:hypothetical protein